MAQKDHWCDRCCTDIKPGYMYEGSVFVSKAHGLYTLKMHIYPECDYPEEPKDDEAVEGLEKVVQEIKKAA